MNGLISRFLGKYVLISVSFSQKERMKYQKDYNKESIKKLEEKVMENKKKYEEFCMTSTAEVVIC